MTNDRRWPDAAPGRSPSTNPHDGAQVSPTSSARSAQLPLVLFRYLSYIARDGRSSADAPFASSLSARDDHPQELPRWIVDPFPVRALGAPRRCGAPARPSSRSHSWPSSSSAVAVELPNRLRSDHRRPVRHPRPPSRPPRRRRPRRRRHVPTSSRFVRCSIVSGRGTSRRTPTPRRSIRCWPSCSSARRTRPSSAASDRWPGNINARWPGSRRRSRTTS